ncbi:MAG: 50S ribosomal protein L11 methyltransferase [Rhabdochlamydiaceae bacterium]
MALNEQTIDWHEQWALFAPNFHNGLAHIVLSNSCRFPLKPGAGFGDLSHPTTQLMLNLLKQTDVPKHLCDIGCGSGILSIAAAYLGCQNIIGFDIDEKALEHSKENAKLNQLEHMIQFFHPERFEGFLSTEMILMNMIMEEQKIAWEQVKKSLSSDNPIKIMTSGILKEQRQDYLKWSKSQGWKLIKTQTKEKWQGFLFSYHLLGKD